MKNRLFLLCVIFCFTACEYITEVGDITESTVVILAPTNNAILDTLSNTFTWEPIEEVDSYHFQIARPTFENAIQIVMDTVLTKTNFLIKLPVNTYEWRIKAENSGYTTGYSKQSFTVEE